MRVWITCFVVLFGAAELLDWLQTFSMPLPIFILGGAFLAIASNYSKLTNLPFHPEHDELEASEPQTLSQSSAQPLNSTVQRPTASSLPSTVQSSESISFAIRKPFQPGD